MLNIVSTYMVAPMRHQISTKGLDYGNSRWKGRIVASLRLRFQPSKAHLILPGQIHSVVGLNKSDLLGQEPEAHLKMRGSWLKSSRGRHRKKCT